MTRDEVVTAAKALGYTHVRTAGAAPVLLDEWTPYSWPERHVEFTLNHDRARIDDLPSLNPPDTFRINTGSWPLIRRHEPEVQGTMC